ncbi:SWPV1-042 [Shearwaterpox virus]|uniref:SWPV1-042 n=1 Tax=Shearwaterpox virus TaxID=1974596 RepID=A0A1V0S7R3_CNPV|nr:SWPV1-042 [Shearwaterpox virus]
MIITSGNLNKKSYNNDCNNCIMNIPIILVISISVSMIVIVPIIILNPRYRCNEFIKYKCPYGWVESDNLCYYISKTKSTWDKGITECNMLGGEFITLSNNDNKFLEKITNVTDNKGYWIGIKRIDGIFKWINGSNINDNILPIKIYKTYNCGYINYLDVCLANCQSKKSYICVKYVNIVTFY